MTVNKVAAGSEDPVLAELTGPGGAFEIVTEDVLGVPLQVYKNRLHSLGELIAMADGRAGVDFLVQGDRRLTYDEHNAMVRRVAASLGELGVGHGDRVAILSANNVEWVVLWWAAAAIGAVVVPLNAWWKTDELELLYLHLQSMRNFTGLPERLAGKAGRDRETDAAAASTDGGTAETKENDGRSKASGSNKTRRAAPQ